MSVPDRKADVGFDQHSRQAPVCSGLVFWPVHMICLAVGRSISEPVWRSSIPGFVDRDDLHPLTAIADDTRANLVGYDEKSDCRDDGTQPEN
ncbi:hypothetical protein KUV75_03120 [Qipengyuania gaetbuli]|uniref:hypothetical protein n=1 Tax=Qipengyuania gaetbuli TaxID=266952 RepID=UPI001C992F73|nr:hypothetical protein [Qipengyuania gaetbuli]MBY6013896.1 hypothetical protein [Qipengyuania gaetbuli]